MKNIIFIAAPASGKGTYSGMLKEGYGYSHISTGDLLRNIVKSGSELGMEVSDVLNSGRLVSDELMFKIIKDALSKLDSDKPFILDGIPRTLEQAIYLEKLFNELNIEDYKVIYLNVSEDIALKRALGRMSCSCGATYNKFFDGFKPKKENICDKCGNELSTRTDDNEESFKQRFETYQQNTLPILDYYEKLDKLGKIDTAKFTHEEIFDIILKMVN